MHNKLLLYLFILEFFLLLFYGYKLTLHGTVRLDLPAQVIVIIERAINGKFSKSMNII